VSKTPSVLSPNEAVPQSVSSSDERIADLESLVRRLTEEVETLRDGYVNRWLREDVERLYTRVDTLQDDLSILSTRLSNPDRY
jgi:chaperonin cofactor prefoldin